MKQTITLSQLNELSPAALDVFKSWYIVKDYYRTNNTGLPHLGQLIEFLQEKGDEDYSDQWAREYFSIENDDRIHRSNLKEKPENQVELIEILWKDVIDLCEKIGALEA